MPRQVIANSHIESRLARAQSFGDAREHARASCVSACAHDVAPTLAVYNISGIASFAKEMDDKGLGKPKVHLSFTLDSSGICALTKAEATVEGNNHSVHGASNRPRQRCRVDQGCGGRGTGTLVWQSSK